MKDEIRRARCGHPRQIDLHILLIDADRFIRASCIGVHHRVAPACHDIDRMAGDAGRGRCQEVDGYGLNIAV